MMLNGKIAVVYGGGGVLGGAAARAFARDGATVYLAGRTREKLEAVAQDITSAGGRAHVAVVDVLDEATLVRHAATVAQQAGRIDVVLNAVGFVHVQGTPLKDLSLDDFERPIRETTRAYFSIAKAVAPHLVPKSVLISLSTPGSKLAFPGVLGFGVACAGVEAMTRHLAAELGPGGVRVVCLRPDLVPETVKLGSHARQVFRPLAEAAGFTVDQIADMKMQPGSSPSLLKRFPHVEEVANTAAFVASDHAGAITGAVLNLSCGSLID
ncbi:MAG TPA: SDR family oxidoreductase [Polyangiaceae bacterium]|nr:SDR family oxidoreductase [Polyangiaceae bacterium]